MFTDHSHDNWAIELSPQVSHALSHGNPLVVTNSIAITHGAKYPHNINNQKGLSDDAQAYNGTLLATIAMVDNKIKVGLTTNDFEDLHNVAQIQNSKKKNNVINYRDITTKLHTQGYGTLSLAATVYIAGLVGIRIVLTNKIDGQSKQSNIQCDGDSEELNILANSPCSVVCSGINGHHDVQKTMAFFESNSVPVVTLNEGNFPGYYQKASKRKTHLSLKTHREIADLVHMQYGILRYENGMLVGLPVHDSLEPNGFFLKSAIDQAVKEFPKSGQKNLNQFVESRLDELTKDLAFGHDNCWDDSRKMYDHMSLKKNMIGACIIAKELYLIRRGLYKTSNHLGNILRPPPPAEEQSTFKKPPPKKIFSPTKLKEADYASEAQSDKQSKSTMRDDVDFVLVRKEDSNRNVNLLQDEPLVFIDTPQQNGNMRKDYPEQITFAQTEPQVQRQDMAVAKAPVTKSMTKQIEPTVGCGKRAPPELEMAPPVQDIVGCGKKPAPTMEMAPLPTMEMAPLPTMELRLDDEPELIACDFMVREEEPVYMKEEELVMCGGVFEDTSDLEKAQKTANKYKKNVETQHGARFLKYNVVKQASQSTWPPKWWITVDTDIGTYKMLI